MPWLLLALCSAACLGGYEIARKQAVEGQAPLPVLCLATLGGWLGLNSLLFLAWLAGVGAETGLELLPLDAKQHVAVLLKALLVTSSWLCAYTAVQHLPISLAAPLRAVSPFWTVLGALLFFGEQPSTVQWWGMVLLFGGYLAFAAAGKAEGISFVANRHVLILVLGTAIGATSGLYDKLLLQGARLPPTTLQFWFSLYGLVLQLGVAYWFWWRLPQRSAFRVRGLAALVGCLLMAADQFYFRCLSDPEALVSVVSLARRSSVLVSFTLGGWLFREQRLRQKGKALLLVLAGLALLILSPESW